MGISELDPSIIDMNSVALLHRNPWLAVLGVNDSGLELYNDNPYHQDLVPSNMFPLTS